MLSSFAISPRLRRGAGGFLPFVRCGRQGFGRYAPRFAPLHPGSLRAFAALPPPALRSGGWWLSGGVAALCGGSLRSRSVCVGGVPCLFPLPLPWFVPPVSLSRRGRVAPWACPSARLLVRCRGLSLWCGFRVRWLLPGSPPRGGGACRPFVAAVSFALVPLALRRAGWFRFRWPRRPLPWGVVALPAPLPSRLRPAARRCWPRRVSSSAALFPAAPPPARVGFSGGRRLSPAFRPLVAGVVSAVVAAGRSVVVGCAGGADRFVRTAAPGAVVFSVASFGSGRGAFAARSIALVRAVAAGGPGSGLVVFPAEPCPDGLLPSAAASACFCGLGSGSWASAAFAVGLGLPLVVFPCGFSVLPPWRAWFPAGAGIWALGFRLS